MKSIRLRLIVYFVVLLTGALGAVSWFSYRTAADSLHVRQSKSEEMIKGQYQQRVETAKAELDRRILLQARAMAGLPLVTIPYEAVHAASVISSPFLLPGTANLPTWTFDLPDTRYWPPVKDPPVKDAKDAPAPPYIPLWILLDQDRRKIQPPPPRPDPQRFFPKFTHVQSSELLVVNADQDHPQEYFQTYQGKDGQPWQRSESMGDSWFELDKDRRDEAKTKLFIDYWDEVELKPGLSVRRVTLKTPVSGYAGVMFPWPGRGKGPPNLKGPPRAFNPTTPTLFIQYAADLGPLHDKIRQFAAERDTQLADLESTITKNLQELRSRMFWVVLATLGAIWLGGYLVIRLGLAPLSKMSDAVSQVTPKNFRLPLDAAGLPDELRPIAERLQEVLEQLQKAFAREKQAAADISHELRTPLAALMTTLEVGLKKPRSLDEYREILDECQSSGQHMYRLVERLLTLARLDAGADQYRPTETDATDIALNCADLIRPLARARGLTLRLHLSDPIVMETDPNKLREVLINLLHNAVEYNQPNGAIDLAVERIDDTVRLEVRDTGIGVKPTELEHLFERFYRADPSRHADTPHAGLGLAIVKSYVDLMGGTIKVESNETGTAFIITLPFVPQAHDLTTAVEAEPMLAGRGDNHASIHR